jgi:hypothetical protein
MIRPQFGPKLNNTGIADLRERGKKLRIWPNPSSGTISIETGEAVLSSAPVISITDLSGREIIRAEYTGTMDISDLAPGSYIVILYTGRRAEAFGRIIKSR